MSPVLIAIGLVLALVGITLSGSGAEPVVVVLGVLTSGLGGILIGLGVTAGSRL